MINYDLPTFYEIDGKRYKIQNNGDYRAVLDVISALKDVNMSNNHKTGVALNIFYDFNIPDDITTAIEKMYEFIDCGEKRKEGNGQETEEPPIMDWEHDWALIVSAVNKVAGYDIRSAKYLHWWTFISMYMEIDENSTFAYVVSLRRKLRKSEPLDNSEREFYNKNRERVNLPIVLSEEDEKFLYGGDE